MTDQKEALIFMTFKMEMLVNIVIVVVLIFGCLSLGLAMMCIFPGIDLYIPIIIWLIPPPIIAFLLYTKFTHYRVMKRVKQNWTWDDMSFQRCKIMELDMPIEEGFDLIRKELKKMNKLTFTRNPPKAYSGYGRYGDGLFRAGVYLQMAPHPDGKCGAVFTFTPMMGLTRHEFENQFEAEEIIPKRIEKAMRKGSNKKLKPSYLEDTQ